MKKFVLIFAVLGLAACNEPLTPAQQALIQSDLNAACPILTQQLDPIIRADTNGNVQKLFLNNVELACPPNPPPTTWAVIDADLVSAAVSLIPYIPRLAQKNQALLNKLITDVGKVAAAHQ